MYIVLFQIQLNRKKRTTNMADKRVKRSTSLARYTVYTDSAIEKLQKLNFIMYEVGFESYRTLVHYRAGGYLVLTSNSPKMYYCNT